MSRNHCQTNGAGRAFLGKIRFERSLMRSATHFGEFLGCAALVLGICQGLTAEGTGDTVQNDGAALPAKVLTICAIPASMPRTDKATDGTPLGLDVAVAQRIGRILGRGVEFHWCANAGCAWNCLPAGRCDMVVGLPHGSGPQRTAAWSVPYAGAQFGLVVSNASGGIHSLAELREKRVGVVAGTLSLSENDHKVIYFKSREALLEGFRTAALDGAFLDADLAAWYLHGHPQLELKLVPEYVPRERWNMAIAVRAKDMQLLVEINRALGQLAETGELKKIYAEYAVPFRPPFTGSKPQKTTFDTWKLIRERRELVVSMDPANLPYSGAKVSIPDLMWSWRELWRSSLMSSCGSTGSTCSMRPQLASSSSVDAISSWARPLRKTQLPTMKSSREKSSTRGLIMGRAMCSSSVKTAHTFIHSRR